MTDKFVFNCVNCPATLAVEWQATVQEIIALAKEGGWEVMKGRVLCDQCKPVTERSEK